MTMSQLTREAIEEYLGIRPPQVPVGRSWLQRRAEPRFEV